jgi:hypothetical protein
MASEIPCIKTMSLPRGKASLFCVSLAQFFELDTETVALILRAEAWQSFQLEDLPKKIPRDFWNSMGILWDFMDLGFDGYKCLGDFTDFHGIVCDVCGMLTRFYGIYPSDEY